MSFDGHDRQVASACGCAGHCVPVLSRGVGESGRPLAESRASATASGRGGAGVWSAIVPAIACSACPACLTVYGTLLSALGVGVSVSEAQHSALMLFALAASLIVSAWRSWRTRRVWPFAVALSGGALVLAGHQADVHVVEWAGVLVLVIGGLVEHVSLRRRRLPELAVSD